MLARDELTATCLAEWSSRGPRYTSYPPASEFSALSSERVTRELRRVATGTAPVSLYLHVPFCKSLCWYCGCNVIPTRDETRGIGYVDALATEMALLGAHSFTAPVTEIAIGGGSPNFLAPKTLHTLVGALERYFPIEKTARRSIELDPRSTTVGQVEMLAKLGFRAMSMGVQDFAGPVQDAIHRHQSVVQTRWLVELARQYHFDDINVDMVYGLPRQNEESFGRTLDAVIELAPDRVALFGYAHLPTKFPHQELVERAGRILDRYERAELLLMAIDRFTAAGYVHLGLDHFARPGSRLAKAAAERRMVRSFQGYVEYQADSILGLGVSAISTTPTMHWQNCTEVAQWEQAIVAQRPPVQRGYVLDADDRMRAELIARLMCDGEIDLRALCARFDAEPAVYFAKELRALDAISALACVDAQHVLRATDLGRVLIRNVCMVFDRYFTAASSERFSATV